MENVIIQYLKNLNTFHQNLCQRGVKRRRSYLAKFPVHNLNLALFLLNSGSIAGVMPSPYQRIWMKPRSNENWQIILNKYDDSEWLENFRMKKDSFVLLCSILRPSLEPKIPLIKAREPVSVEKQVAVCLYKLCSCCKYRVVGSVFGIHKATVKKCMYNVTEAIIHHMMRSYLYFPNETEAEEIASHFEHVTKIPMLLAAIDGTHIPIKPPKNRYRDFINRKGWASYNMQAVVDHKCRFRNVFIKYPGVHDATVLKGSNLYKQHRQIIPQVQQVFNNTNIQYMIIGDPAYPLLDWILKGYSGPCSPKEESFNVYLNSGRVVVEWAFGRLKARFRILLKRIDINYTFVPKIVVACCIIHNFIEDRKDSFIQQWLNDVESAELVLPQPRQPIQTQADVTASQVRRTICNYLGANFPLKKSSLR